MLIDQRLRPVCGVVLIANISTVRGGEAAIGFGWARQGEDGIPLLLAIPFAWTNIDRSGLRPRWSIISEAFGLVAADSFNQS